MIKLNDYLYDGDTVLRILQRYSADLRTHAILQRNSVDMAHSNFLVQVLEILEHNDFLVSQSQRIREFYKYMVREYPVLAFTFKGRIKSLVRAEEKFNGYVVEYISDYYRQTGEIPTPAQLKEKLGCFRDLIAYRIVLAVPKCHMKNDADRKQQELRYLYTIANALPEFLEQRGFTAEPSGHIDAVQSEFMDDAVRPYYRDYVANPTETGYQSLHITFYDNHARCFIEVQLRTKAMDDLAEIGFANHANYEKKQAADRARHDSVPKGLSVYFDEAVERGLALQQLDLSKLDVCLFAAVNNYLINDGCGLYRGRQILPYEHLSRYQNDIID